MNRKERRAAPKQKDHRSLCRLAVLMEESGKIGEAIESYRQALEIDPSIYRAHNNLGRLLQRRGLLDEAAAHYERALALEPACYATTARCRCG